MGLGCAQASKTALRFAVLLVLLSPPLFVRASSGDELCIGRKWQALGPFPSGTREWPLTFPDALIPTAREPFSRLEHSDESQFPSSLVDGGLALWRTFDARDDGWVNVTWPAIRWDHLRTSMGWAGLQHQTLLRTRLVVSTEGALRAAVSLTEGAEWAIFSSSSGDVHWRMGDTYSYGSADGDPRTLGHLVSIPPGEHTLVVRSVYDLRTSGDPHASSRGLDRSLDGVPVASFKLAARVVEDQEIVHAMPDRSLMPDLLDDGKPASRFVGVALRNLSPAKVTVTGVRPGRLVFGPGQSLQPGQTRHVAVDLGPDARLRPEETSIVVTGLGHESAWTATTRLHPKPIESDRPFTFTFLDADGSVQYAKALPPAFSNSSASSPCLRLQDSPSVAAPPLLSPIVVALHGAGVSVAQDDWWTESVPQQQHSWVVFPTGRTPWGYDWHGPSLVNVEKAVEALAEEGGVWDRWSEGRTGTWRRPDAGRLVVVGHSNGGQGVWYLASRYPDRVKAVIPAAGYIKIQSYVPYLWSSHHVHPPNLAAVLTSSLAPYDNDLHMSNLFGTPLLAIHGADDGNVPVWHGRQMVSLVRDWSGRDDLARFEEVPGRDHWWPAVFRRRTAADFLDRATGDVVETDAANEFTLTVSNPVESGSLRGFRVSQLEEGGTVARLRIRIWGATATIFTTNVAAFSVPPHFERLVVDGKPFLPPRDQRPEMIRRSVGGEWSASSQPVPRRGPLTAVLNTVGPLTIIYPASSADLLDVATRLAHDLFVYLDLDVQILSDEDALDPPTLAGVGNVVVLGDPFGNQWHHVFQDAMRTAVRWQARGTFTVGSRVFTDPGDGLIFQAPHPLAPDRSVVVICGTDLRGILHAVRLFPLRTGVPAPDWAVVGGDGRFEDQGVKSAGFWKADFSLGWSAW